MGAFLLVTFAIRIWLRLTFGPDYDDDRPVAMPTMAPTHPFAATVAPLTLAPGTCLDRAPVNFVRAVPCDQSHISEIVAAFPYEAPPGAPYPQLIDVYRPSLDRCKSEFDAYAVGSSDASGAGYFVAAPTRWDWDQGERRIVCYATGRNGDALTASVRGGGR